MKKIVAGTLAAALVLPAMAVNVFADEKGVDIKSTFKDENLQKFVADELDLDKDGSLSNDEIDCARYIYCDGREIESLEGIEVFSSLEELYCNYNKLTKIDVSSLKNLKSLYVDGNQLTKLDVSANTNLSVLFCGSNKLTELDVSKLTNLEQLDCMNNQLTSLDVSNNTELAYLLCGENNIPSINLSKNPNLEVLQINQCGITSLDVSKNIKLTSLDVANNALTTLDLSNNKQLVSISCGLNKISSIDLSNQTHLTDLYISDTFIDNIDVSMCPALNSLVISRTNITKLDTSKNEALAWLDISANPNISFDLSNNKELYGLYAISCSLKSLDLSNNTKIENLQISANELKSIDVTGLPKLNTLIVNDNYLESLDLSKNVNLSSVQCQRNKLKELVLGNNPALSSVNAYDNQIATIDFTGTIIGGADLDAVIDDCVLICVGGSPESDHIPFQHPSNDSYIGNSIALIVDAGAELKGMDNELPAEEGAAAFAERLYSTCLGRTSELPGKQYWIHNLGAGVTGADVAYGFFFSPEFTEAKYSDSEYVNRLYNTFMGREADKAGLDYWTKNLKGGMTREDVFYGFINSTEWADCCLKAGILSGGSAKPSFTKKPNELVTNFAERLYTTCLGRESDPAGIKYWSAELANMNISGTAAAQGFFFSPEFDSLRLSDGEYITRLYLTFMDREPDDDGMGYWMEQLENGCTRMDVFVGFSAADEFINICTRAGIVR